MNMLLVAVFVILFGILMEIPTGIIMSMETNESFNLGD